MEITSVFSIHTKLERENRKCVSCSTRPDDVQPRNRYVSPLRRARARGHCSIAALAHAARRPPARRRRSGSMARDVIHFSAPKNPVARCDHTHINKHRTNYLTDASAELRV
ncbi:hypothetical protein EVAR_39075_1 [Eumeta japonica]|uniref:Uncharacterized protein n=1 Tax=Eumeta variegata TaxID=151549 RepID=A0A4C1WPV3_EUMVA|nr:hypothetical protein EVAR_39075_1 [Eumeta japonica]